MINTKLFKPIYPARDLSYSPTYKNTYNQTPVMGQKFGENLNPTYAQQGLKGHNGIDIPCAEGTPVFASHDGTVVKLSTKPTYGLGITIQSNDGSYKTIYWHLQQILVSIGQVVKAFDLIGLANSTGNSTGNHLHFGLYPTGEPQDNGYGGAVDPLSYIVETPHFEFTRNLSIGMKGDDVKNLQICLANEGFLGQVGFLSFTGFFGLMTFDAVRKFQTKYGIISTGFCGEKTRSALNKIYNV